MASAATSTAQRPQGAEQPQMIILSTGAQIPPSGASLLSDQQTAMLDSFMRDGLTRDHINTAVDRFKNLASIIKSAEEKFTRFKEHCTANGTGQGYHLPNSLRTNLLERVKLPKVESDPAFFDDTLTALRDAERTYNDKVFKILREAKSKHIAFLKLNAQPDKIIAAAMLQFTAYMHAIAESLEEQRGLHPGEPSQRGGNKDDIRFPRQQASKEFFRELTQQLATASMHIAAEAQRAVEAASLRREAERAAQEAVLKGAHSGATMNAIAEQAAERVVQRILSRHHDTLLPAPSQASTSMFSGAATQSGAKQRQHDSSATPWHNALDYRASNSHGVARPPRRFSYPLHPAFLSRTDTTAPQPREVQGNPRRQRAQSEENDAEHGTTSHIKRRRVQLVDSLKAQASSPTSGLGVREAPIAAATVASTPPSSPGDQPTTVSNNTAHANHMNRTLASGLMTEPSTRDECAASNAQGPSLSA